LSLHGHTDDVGPTSAPAATCGPAGTGVPAGIAVVAGDKTTRVAGMGAQPPHMARGDGVVSVDINDPGSPRNKYRTRESAKQLRLILVDWDLTGLVGFVGVEEAADEYDCMISPILHLLHDGADAAALRAWIFEEVAQHFGMDADPVREGALVDQVTAWWRRRAVDPVTD